MINEGGVRIQTNFESFVVVGFNSKAGHKAFDHKVHVLVQEVRTSAEWLVRSEELSLEGNEEFI